MLLRSYDILPDYPNKRLTRKCPSLQDVMLVKCHFGLWHIGQMCVSLMSFYGMAWHQIFVNRFEDSIRIFTFSTKVIFFSLSLIFWNTEWNLNQATFFRTFEHFFGLFTWCRSCRTPLSWTCLWTPWRSPAINVVKFFFLRHRQGTQISHSLCLSQAFSAQSKIW